MEETNYLNYISLCLVQASNSLAQRLFLNFAKILMSMLQNKPPK